MDRTPASPARLTGWKIDVKSLSAAEKMNLKMTEDEEEEYPEEELAEETEQIPEDSAPAEESGEPEAAEAEPEISGEPAAEEPPERTARRNKGFFPTTLKTEA